MLSHLKKNPKKTLKDLSSFCAAWWPSGQHVCLTILSFEVSLRSFSCGLFMLLPRLCGCCPASCHIPKKIRVYNLSMDVNGRAMVVCFVGVQSKAFSPKAFMTTSRKLIPFFGGLNRLFRFHSASSDPSSHPKIIVIHGKSVQNNHLAFVAPSRASAFDF